MASKRPIVSDGNTLGKPANKRIPVQGSWRKSLFLEPNSLPSKSAGPREWSTQELSALVQHICLFWEDMWTDRWRTMKNEAVWNACENSVNKTCNSSRTGLLNMISSVWFRFYFIHNLNLLWFKSYYVKIKVLILSYLILNVSHLA